MASVSGSPSPGGQRSRFSKLLLRSTGSDSPPSNGPPPPPPKDNDLPPPTSYGSRSLPRTASPTSRFRRPPIPSPVASTSYSFSSNPSLQGGLNSPVLSDTGPPSPPYPPSHQPSSSQNGSIHSYNSLPQRTHHPHHGPSPTITSAAGGSGTSSQSGQPPPTHLKGKKSWTLLKRPASSTNLSFRSVETEELQPQRYASSSLPPRSGGAGGGGGQAGPTGWDDGEPPMSVPLADPDAGPSTLTTGQHARRPSGAQELKRKGSRILSNMRKSGSAALLGKAATGVDPDQYQGSREEQSGSGSGQRSRKNSVNVNVHVWKDDGREQDGVEAEDAGIGMPFNVVHQLHVESDDLSALPPGWVDILKAQGLSSTELLALAKSKSRSQMDRAAATNTPIPQPADSSSPQRTPPSNSQSTPPRLPPLSYVSPTQTSESPPPPPSPSRPPLGTTRMSSRLSLQLRDFQGHDFLSRDGKDDDWAQGLLSEALGKGDSTIPVVVTPPPTNGGPPRLPELVADSVSFLSPTEDRTPMTPREQRSDRLAKMGAGRRPSDPSSGGEGPSGIGTGAESVSSCYSRESSAAEKQPATHAASPPVSYVPPTRKESFPASQRSFSGSSAGSTTDAPAVTRPPPAIVRPLPTAPSPPPSTSTAAAHLPLLPSALLTSAPIRRPLPVIPTQVEQEERPSSSARDMPPRRSSLRQDEDSDGDSPLSNTFGAPTGTLAGGRRSPEPNLPNGREYVHSNGHDRDASSDDEGGLAYLVDEEFGGRRMGVNLPQGNGTFGPSSSSRRPSDHPIEATSTSPTLPTSPAGRTSSLYSQSSETSLVPSLNASAPPPSLDRSASHHSSRSSKPSLQMRNSPSFGSVRSGGVDSRLSVATATSRVTSMTPSFLSSGSHLSMEEEAVISRAVIVPSTSSSSNGFHHPHHPHHHHSPHSPDKTSTTRHFATPSLSRPTKPNRLTLGAAGSNGSTASPPAPAPASTTSPMPKSISNGSVASAGSQQSMFEEAELALDEAVKMLGSPERRRGAEDGGGRGGEGGGEQQPTTPGTPAYSDFLHDYGSEEEEGGGRRGSP